MADRSRTQSACFDHLIGLGRETIWPRPATAGLLINIHNVKIKPKAVPMLVSANRPS